LGTKLFFSVGGSQYELKIENLSCELNEENENGLNI